MGESVRNRRPLYLQQTTSHQDRWMISYTDVVTILLILFIAIAVQASQSRTPMPLPLLVAAPRRPDAALSMAQATLQQHGITLRMERRGLVITLPQAVLFPSGEDSIRDEALPTIEQIAAVLRDLDNKVLLIGHADTTPIHNRYFRNNWELSAARSIQLLEVLTKQFGLSEGRFSVASEGSFNPTGRNDNEDGRARNRRVEIVILDEALGKAP